MSGSRESRAPSLGAKAMETVKNLERSREELPGVEGVNVQKVAAGTGEAVPGPVTAEQRRSVVPYNRCEPGSGRPGGTASEAAVVPVEPDGQHNRR